MAKPPTPSPPPPLLLSLLLLHLFLLLLSPVSAYSSGPEGMTMSQVGDFILRNANNNKCKGSMAECLHQTSEFEMSSESNRRILATSQYISYGALQANRVPCSQRGASYYNCIPGGSANPYTRGCSSISRCRR